MSQNKLSDLNAGSKGDFVAALANVFEYSPWIAEQAAVARPFAGVTQLFDAMKAAVDHAAPELRLALIKAHPDLADKTQRAAGLTEESSAEQNSLGLDRLSDAEYEAFERVFLMSSACGAKPRTPFCAISNAACGATSQPKRKDRSRRSAGSRRCASISW
jgi:OHCU decarboxylase